MSSKNFKECHKHGWLSKSSFYAQKHKGRKNLFYQCKICCKEYRQTQAGRDNRNRLRREWGKKHLDKERAMYRAKVRKKPDLYKDNAKRERAKLRLEVLQHYSGSETPFCACCGDARIEFLALDHKNGGGNKHRIKLFGRKDASSGMYRWARSNNYPEIFQVLCHNCNFAIGHYGYCPHQREKASSI